MTDIFRGGVLEPEGTVEIKYRKRELQKTMRRIDDTCKQIVERMNNPQIDPAEHAKLEKQLTEREEKLLPMYHQVAVHFADLHDTPGRMEELGVISVCILYITKIFLACMIRLSEMQELVNCNVVDLSNPRAWFIVM